MFRFSRAMFLPFKRPGNGVVVPPRCRPLGSAVAAAAQIQSVKKRVQRRKLIAAKNDTSQDVSTAPPVAPPYDLRDSLGCNNNNFLFRRR